MQRNHTQIAPTVRETTLQTGELVRFILKGFSYAVYGLFVVIDGGSNAESFNARMLTIPYFVGGLALTRAFCEALDQHHDGHAAIFAVGLSTLSALA